MRNPSEPGEMAAPTGYRFFGSGLSLPLFFLSSSSVLRLRSRTCHSTSDDLIRSLAITFPRPFFLPACRREISLVHPTPASVQRTQHGSARSQRILRRKHWSQGTKTSEFFVAGRVFISCLCLIELTMYVVQLFIVSRNCIRPRFCCELFGPFEIPCRKPW